MWNNPIIQRELVGTLRTRRATAVIVGTAVLFAMLVGLQWPTDSLVQLSGAQSQQVFRLFGYGLLAAVVLLAPVFPATSVVREKQEGTLALLLNSPMRPWMIYGGKLIGQFSFILLLMSISLPAAAACYAMGGVALFDNIGRLYAVLALAALEYTALALLVSTLSRSADSALRVTYGCILLLVFISLGPHFFFQGSGTLKATIGEHLRCLSPLPAAMEAMDQGDVGAQGVQFGSAVTPRFFLFGMLATAALAVSTLSQLNHRLFDRSRWQGKITDDRSSPVRAFRRIFFLVDPQRRKAGIGPLMNPITVKEFRCRRFGRMHWMLRLAAVSSLVSLGLTYAATMGTMDWGAETIGGIMVLLQSALVVVLAPSLAASLISAEVESGGWQLLQMTPLSTLRILTGKFASVIWPILLIIVSTVPGYLVMVYIQPEMWLQIRQVLICLLLTAAFSIGLSYACSSIFPRTAVSTAVAYALLTIICAGTMFVWLLRDNPFGHATVEVTLMINPIAAALSVIQTPGFTTYNLLPGNWWFLGISTVCFAVIVFLRTAYRMRPQ